MPTDNQQSRQFQQIYGADPPHQRFFWQGYSSRLLGIVEGENGATYEGVVSGNASLPLGAEVLFIPGERPNDIGMIVKPDLGTPSQEAAADMNEVGTIVRAGDPNVDPIIRGRVVDKRSDTLYDPDTFTLYYWDKETRTWIPISQLASGSGAPAIASTVPGGWYFRESNGDVYKGDGSAWTLFSGGSSGGCCVSWELDYTAFLEGAESAERVRALVFDRDPTLSITTVTPSGGELPIQYPDTAFYSVAYTYQPSNPEEPPINDTATNGGESNQFGEAYNVSVTASIEPNPSDPGNNRLRIVITYTTTFGTPGSITRLVTEDGSITAIGAIDFASSTPNNALATPGEYQITVNGKWLNGDARNPPPYQQTVSAYFLPTGTLTQYE